MPKNDNKLFIDKLEASIIIFALDTREEYITGPNSPYIKQEACKISEITDIRMLRDRIKEFFKF